MDFGLVLQADPPASRVIDSPERAEAAGFSARVDVRLPPAVGGAVRHLQPDPRRRPSGSMVGPMVTNPATRDWTVTASLFATLNEMYGNRTVCGIGRGDSAVRVINGKPVRLAAPARVDRGHPRAGQRARRSTTRAPSCSFAWNPDSRLEIWVAAYGPKALALAGEVGDGFILQLADPRHHRVEHRRRAARGRGGRQATRTTLTICVAAPAYVTDGSAAQPRARARAVPLVRRHGRQPRRRHRRPLRRRRRRGPDRADRLHQGPRGLRLQRARPRRQHAHDVRARRDRRPLLPHRARPRTRSRGCEELAGLGVDQFALYLQHDAKDATLAAYGEHVIPQVTAARA